MKPIKSKKMDLPSLMIAFLLVLLIAGWSGKFLNGTCARIIIILILVFAVVGFRQWKKDFVPAVKPRLPDKPGAPQAPPISNIPAGPMQVMRPAGYDPENDALWGLRYAANEAEILKQVVEISIDRQGLFMKNAARETLCQIAHTDIRMIFPDVKLSIVPREGKAIALPPWTAQYDAQIVASLITLAGLEKKVTTEEFRGEMVEKTIYLRKES
jgi:hypothetical protein